MISVTEKQLANLDPSGKSRWTEKELKKLSSMRAKGFTAERMAAFLPRTVRAIELKLERVAKREAKLRTAEYIRRKAAAEPKLRKSKGFKVGSIVLFKNELYLMDSYVEDSRKKRAVLVDIGGRKSEAHVRFIRPVPDNIKEEYPNSITALKDLKNGKPVKTKAPSSEGYILLYRNPEGNYRIEDIKNDKGFYETEEAAVKAIYEAEASLTEEERETRAIECGDGVWEYAVAKIILPLSVRYETSVNTYINGDPVES